MVLAAYITNAHAFLAPGRYDPSRRRAARDKGPRAALLMAIAVIHCVLIWWLVTSSGIARTAPPDVMRVIAVALAPIPAPDPRPPAPAAPPPPSTEPLEPAVELPQAPSPNPLPAPTAARSPSITAGGGGCAVAMTIGRAIEADPQAMRALAALTPEFRTAADAIMLWNGDWSPASVYRGGGESADPLRQLVMREIAAVPIECRESGMVGPRLIAVADRGKTAMLAVGSGVWRWADLLLEPESGGQSTGQFD